MSGNDILARVRRAVHMADSLHIADNGTAEELLRAVEQCRKSVHELQRVVEQLKTTSSAAAEARMELLEHLNVLDCGDKLLRSMIDTSQSQSEIHMQTPPGQVQ